MDPVSEPAAPISPKRTIILLVVFCLAVVGSFAATQRQLYVMQKRMDADSVNTNDSLSRLTVTTSSNSESLQNLYGTLSNIISEEEKKNQTIQDQLGKVSGTVTALDKLSKSDPQLLKKYSKIYFLNEHYSPAQVVDIDKTFTLNKNITYQIHDQVAPFLNQLLSDAKATGLDLLIASAYRSFSTQADVKLVNMIKFGTTKANTFSADQGYSEHQLGTTLDFTTLKTGAVFGQFASTPEYTWLTENAYRYGFILSYPKGNTYYIYEPWHWRFVGIDLATRLHYTGKYFYDTEQKEIDTYLVDMFEKR
ncbi:MAG: hypothetical protein RJB39_609 [Candidatus Parcubacteria bacterium]|jgi:D-alanyl-D-alanine carboxypeptidase